MPRKPIYKIIFHNQGKVYEIYAGSVHQCAMFSFIEVEKLILKDLHGGRSCRRKS